MRITGTHLSFSLTLQLAAIVGWAQGTDSLPAGRPYIKKINEYLTFRMSLNNDLKGFAVDNVVHYDILPNNRNVLKLSANYRWLSLSFGSSSDIIPGNNDDDEKGSTRATGLGLNLNFSHWLQQLAYSRVKGYYLGNTADFDPAWRPGDPYARFPDLQYKSYFGQTAYQFNERFSFNALTTQSERQLRSAGSFIPSLSYHYYIVDDKTPLTGSNSSQKSKNFEALLSAGYLYTYVIRQQCYLSAGLIPGAGYIWTKLYTRLPAGNYITHYANPVFRLEGNAGAGFNGERFFAGTWVSLSTESYNQQKTSNVIISDRLIYHFFAGYRLRAPKKLKEQMDAIDQRVYEMRQSAKK